MTDQIELLSQYRLSNAAERFQRSRVGCVVALIAFPMGTTLDLVLYPDLLLELSLIRYLSLLFIGLIFVFHRQDWFKNNIFVTGFAMPFTVAASMCSMIAITEGFSGPYYAALCLLIVGVSLLLPFTLNDAIILLVFTMIAFTIAGFYYGVDLSLWREMYNNIYFVLATGLIACAASFFAERARVREFSLRFELDQRNHELDQRNHDLAEMDRMKSSFFANISHELRTPLTLILSPVEDILRNVELPHRLKTQLIFVRDNSYRLLNLVNDLLDIMRLEEGMTRLESAPVKLNSLVNNVAGGMQHFAQQQNVELKVVSSSDLSVLGDRRAIEKVAINLVNNAVKFTPARGRVTVRIRENDGFAEMIVEDTGPGIEKNNFEMIFDRFQQVDSSSTRKHQGTGLGLALVRELVELQGGKVVVESEMGRGAIFKVRLPLGKGSEKVKSVLESGGDFLGDIHTRAKYAPQMGSLDTDSRDSAQIIDENDARPRLLIIEDETDVRAYLKEILREDFQVFTAATGQIGWQMLKSNMPDIVITDLMLPELDGLTLCKMVREDEDLRNVKIMLLTARTDEKSRLEALDNGADDFLTKPFSTIEIKKRLANLWLTSQLQRTIHQRNLELESTLSDLQSTQGKLIQSEKLNALGRLAAGLLHEVNNPLNYAYGTFQLLEREPSLKEQEHIQDMMRDIRDGMERISAIVKDLKTFAYPEAVHLTQEFDVKEAISSAERLSAHSLRGIKIVKDFDETTIVVGSQSHIVQVLINLFENACHAMESSEREASIRISTEKVDRRLKLSIRDSGTGVPKEIMEKVFDPFFTTKEVGTGLGMGLSTCHTIVENHGGVLSLDTDSATYTEFYFDLALPDQAIDKHLEGDN